jgi:hypothetical protein
MSAAEIFAMLPDSEDMNTPASLPSIAVTSSEPSRATVPSLGSSSAVAPPSIPASIPGVTDGPTFAPTAPAAAAYALPNVQAPGTTPTMPADGAAPKPKPKKRRKKKKSWAKRIRTFVSRLLWTAVLLGILGGAAFAVKKYVIDRPKWTDETQAIAEQVEAATGATFAGPIRLNELAPADYAVRRASVALGIDGDDPTADSATWSAVGVISEPLDLAAIGAQPSMHGVAFYDPAADELFVNTEATPRLRESSLRHAITVALTYQSSGGQADSRSAETARWLHADSVADAVTATLNAADDPTIQDARNVELLEALGSVLPSDPYIQTLLGDGTSLPVIGPITTAISTMPATDLALLDPLGSHVATPPDSMGGLFWYHALAARIDDRAAWTAITTVASDLTTVVVEPTRTCVDVSFSAQAGLELLTAAFTEWAAAAPAGSEASAAVRGTVLAVRTCEPAPGSAQSLVTTDLLGGAPAERQALALLVQADPAANLDRQRCVVTAVRVSGVAPDAAPAACPPA